MKMEAIKRHPLWIAALLIGIVKSMEFAIDSQAIFYFDSPAFILNALKIGFIPYRSYVYGILIRLVAVPFHSLPMLVAVQTLMGGITAWLLAFLLVRFLRVRAGIAVFAALAFAIDPVQVIHEHLVMTETAAMLAMAVYLVVALEYLRRSSDGWVAWFWLIILSILGVLLVSLRTVYLPPVLTVAFLLPISANLWAPARASRLLPLTLALTISLGSALLLQRAYWQFTEPNPRQSNWAGFFLLANASPLVEPRDSPDERVAAAIVAQSRSRLPLVADLRTNQVWEPDGLGARIRKLFGDDDRKADAVAKQLAVAAIRRNPVGYLRLGIHNYLNYWRGIPQLPQTLRSENGLQHPEAITAGAAQMIASAFWEDVSDQASWLTASRRYHIAARVWCVFLLASPFLLGPALLVRPANRKFVALLLAWDCLLLISTCLGGDESAYRYLHPFSFTGLAAAAIVCDLLVHRTNKPSSP